MVTRLSVGSLFSIQDHLSYNEVPNLLILVHQEKHHLK